MKTKFKVLIGDITKLSVDAIVNAANSELRPGHGVCGAIYAAAGPALEQETLQLGRCATGKAKISGAHGISQVKHIIHAVGPIYGELDRLKRKSGVVSAGYRGEDILLEAAYKSALIEAKNAGCRSIAFPCISTGVYGYPKDEAALVAIRTCVNFCLATNEIDTFDEIVFVCFLEEDYDIYQVMCGAMVLPGVDFKNVVADNFTFEPKPAVAPSTPLDSFLRIADETAN